MASAEAPVAGGAVAGPAPAGRFEPSPADGVPPDGDATAGADRSNGARPDLASVAVDLARALRAGGVAVPPDAAAAFAASLGHVGVDRRSAAYWAGRATLVCRPEDVPAYDRAFAGTFDGAVVAPPATVAQVEPVGLDDGVDAPPPGPDQADAELVPSGRAVRWSEVEVLRHKDFAECTPDERAEVHRLVADLRLAGARRRSRRLRPTRRRNGPVDLRATARRSLRWGGEPVTWSHRAPGDRPRRVVLLCDVSGSMEPYARLLVRFAHAVASGRPQVEVFTLGTRCTRITRQLRTHDPDAALAAAGAAVGDWSGGTRLGDGVRAFNDAWGARGLARGAVVVVLSDGWDRGDPEELSGQLARLRRVCHRLVWVNPLKATPGFAPLARGMAAALPHLDELVEGHSLASLEDLAVVIGAGS